MSRRGASGVSASVVQSRFQRLCKDAALAAFDELAQAVDRARGFAASDGVIHQLDLRDRAEAAMNALQSLESTRRFLAGPPAPADPLADPRYDCGHELQLSRTAALPAASTTRHLGAHDA